MASPYFMRRKARVFSMAEYHTGTVTTQELRYRITIPLKTRMMMTTIKITRIKIKSHQNIQTWHPLRRIAESITRNYGCTTSGG